MIWLEVGTTNNDLEVIAYYYMKSIIDLKHLPTLVRSDNGTENTYMETLQKCLRFNHDDLAGVKIYIIG